MNEQKKKQLEIAKKIVEQGNCDGIDCYGGYGLECPFSGINCKGKGVDLAKAYIKEHSEISKRDLLERVENLEERVEGMKKACAPGGCSSSDNARNLKRQLENDILSLVTKYEERTGLKISEIDLKTGPFLFLDIFKRDGEEQRNKVARKNHIVNVKVTL